MYIQMQYNTRYLGSLLLLNVIELAVENMLNSKVLPPFLLILCFTLQVWTTERSPNIIVMLMDDVCMKIYNCTAVYSNVMLAYFTKCHLFILSSKQEVSSLIASLFILLLQKQILPFVSYTRKNLTTCQQDVFKTSL